MIFCDSQVLGAAGVEVFYPAEMVEKVEQEVSPSRTSHWLCEQNENIESLHFSCFFFQEREVTMPREEMEELVVQEDTESNRLLLRKKVKKKTL